MRPELLINSEVAVKPFVTYTLEQLGNSDHLSKCKALSLPAGLWKTPKIIMNNYPDY